MANNQAVYEDALNRGHSYSWDQKWQEAIHAFDQAIAEINNQPAPYAGLGMAYFEMGNLSKALDNYKLAARYSQGDLIYLRQVADVQERLGKLAEAGQTYMAIGEIQLRRRLLDDAMDNWNRAVRLSPNLLGAHQRLATVYQRQENVRAAIREYLAIARIFQMQGDRKKAMQTCRVALKLDPHNADILTAIELIKRGEAGFQDEEEQEVSAETTEETEDKFIAVKRIASAFEQERASWQLPTEEQTGVEYSPIETARQMAMEQLAQELFSDEEDSDEDMFAETGGSMSKLERDALISQALDYQTRGQMEEAITCYQKAVAGGVTSTAVRFNLGLLYQENLRFENAIREFQYVVRDPEYTLASHFAMGESYRANGDIENAVKHFVDVLKMVDTKTVEPSQIQQLNSLYNDFVKGLINKNEPERATNFSNALVEFLSVKDWQSNAQRARQQLNTLADKERMMILGDFLTAGSAQVLDSIYLSNEYAKEGMYVTAMEEAYRAIQLTPDYLPAHWQLGEMLAKQNHHQAASLKFTTLGDTYSARNDINNAINAYERVSDLNPLDTLAREKLITMLQKHEHFDRALKHTMAMAKTYYQLAQVDKAKAIYQEALKLAPKGSSENNWRVKILKATADIDMERLDWKRSLLTYRELRTVAPDDEQVAITLFDLHYKLGQQQNAIRELDRFLIDLVKMRKGPRVISILEDLVNQHPDDPNLVERLSRLYLQQKRVSDAIDILDKLGEAQLDKGDNANAMVTLEKIMRLNPPNVAMYTQLYTQLKQSIQGTN